MPLGIWCGLVPDCAALRVVNSVFTALPDDGGLQAPLLLFLPCFILLKIKSAPTEVSALKNATPIVAKQILNAKGIPYCHPSGGAFLAKSYRMTSKRVHCTCYYNNTGTPRFAVLRFVWCSYYTARLWQHFAIKIFQKSA